MTTVGITSLYEDKTIIANTRSKEIIRTTKSVTNWGLLRSFNSVLADWNVLSPTTRKLPLKDFKNVLRKTFM